MVASPVVKYLEDAGITINGDKPYDIRVNDEKVFRSLGLQPSLAAGESYVAGMWDCDKLDEFFYRICRENIDATFNNKLLVAASSLVNSIVNLQTRFRSLEVAEKHYNLGNDLYRQMLGPSMAYTCAYWKDAKDLDEAQYNKYDLICRKIHLQPGDKVLELGCGWGMFAKYAAEKYGASVVAVNISTEQVRFAKEACQGLPVEFHLCDYRDSGIYNPTGTKFDKIVSIGLCEHVGAKNYRTFLKTALENINESGLFLLHTIGKNISDYYADPWIKKYIFPNGMLPTIKLLSSAMEGLFTLEDLHNIGADYDKTLMAWHKNFDAHWEELRPAYGDNFYRLWSYYLLSCAGGFRARSMQLWQLVLSPKGVLGGYKPQR